MYNIIYHDNTTFSIPCNDNNKYHISWCFALNDNYNYFTSLLEKLIDDS